MSTISPLEHTAIGALAGVTEVTLMQPTVALKNALQEGRPIPRSLPALYRGLLANAGGMLPICATQFGMNKVFDGVYRRTLGSSPGDGGKIAVAMAAGATSAVFACPAEYVMIQQQKSGRSLTAELRNILTQEGPLVVYRGMGATIVRETLYAAGYLGVVPVLRASFEKIPSVNDVPGGPVVLSGLAAGVLATVTTHPADTIKTRMQACYDRPEYARLGSSVAHIVRNEGLSSVFAGLLPRAFRIICAVFILTGTRNTAISFLEERRAPGPMETVVV